MEKFLDIVKQWLRPDTTNQIWNVAITLLIFIIGWLICKAVAATMQSLLEKLKINERLNTKDAKNPIQIQEMLSKFVYYILLIYVLVICLNKLGISGVLTPIENMLMEFFGLIPNIVGAALISFIGYILAKTVSTLVEAASKGIDPLVSKVGVSEKLTVSKLLGQLVFIFILIPIIIIALDTLGVDTISKPAISMLEKFTNAIPNIVTALLLLIISYILGKLITNFIAEFLKNFGADDIPAKVGANNIFGKLSFSKLCGKVLFFFIMLAAAMSAVNKLEMPHMSEIFSNLLEFSGNIVLGLIVLAVGNFLANFAHKTLTKSTKGGIYPEILKYAILTLVLAMGLHTMGIAEEIVRIAFIFIFGTLSLSTIIAIGLSFGLGGREPAGKAMKKLIDKFSK